MICAVTTLIGKALDVWTVVKSAQILLSLEFEQTEMSAFLTSSEMKLLASNVFLISLLKTKSNSVSSTLFREFEMSFKVKTAFLLSEDLKLLTSLMSYGMMSLTTEWFKSYL